MIDEVRELYRAYFQDLRMRQFQNTITVYWSRDEIPGYSMTFKKVDHKTSLTIGNGTIKFASSTALGRERW